MAAISSALGSAECLHQFLADRADLGHGVDHVDRHANRSALIGDGPSDRLTNPPGGVGREFIATGVFKLIDRPHQAGVALLNQVEEAQPAVAVAFGDRDDQPQVAGGQAALGGVVLFEKAVGLLHPAAQRGGALQRNPHQVV